MTLSEFGYTPEIQDQFEEIAPPETVVARVIEEQRGLYRIATAARESHAKATGRLQRDAGERVDLPAVGDWVAVTDETTGDVALIHAVLPRRTALVRKRSGETAEGQVIAANVDVVFIVAALDGDFNLRRIERSLALVQECGALPVVLLNKADLCETADECRAEVEACAPGVEVHVLNALERDGYASFAHHVGPGRSGALIGSSGVGKSTIVNGLVGSEAQRTAPVRARDNRGQHTTTSRQLIPLPTGGCLVDTPGMRQFGLWESTEAMGSTFGEIDELALQCRFRDCGHSSEPGCAVEAAIDGGDLDAARLDSYRKLKRELAHMERQQNARAALMEKRRAKALTKSVRKRPNRRA